MTYPAIATTPARRSESEGANLFAWGHANGIETPSVELLFSEEEVRGEGGGTARRAIGLKSKKEIFKGETLLQVPQKMLLCGNKAVETFGVRSINSMVEKIRSVDPLDPWAHSHMGAYSESILIVSLLIEKARGKESVWGPYLNWLPKVG